MVASLRITCPLLPSGIQILQIMCLQHSLGPVGEAGKLPELGHLWDQQSGIQARFPGHPSGLLAILSVIVKSPVTLSPFLWCDVLTPLPSVGST